MPRPGFMPRDPRALARGFVIAWFAIGGVGHFVATDFFAGIMPDAIPATLHVPAVYVSGVLELVLAAGLLAPRWRAWAGWGLMLLTVAVTPANVHMWLNPEQFSNIPPWLLTARLVFQGVLLWLIWWSSRPVPPRQAT